MLCDLTGEFDVTRKIRVNANIQQALFEQLPERISRTRRNSVLAKKRKQDSSPHLHTKATHLDVKTEFGAPARASTFPHSRSRSVDRKQTFVSLNDNTQKFDAMAFPNANTTNFYDLSHSVAGESIGTPPLSAGYSQSHASFPASPGTLSNEPSFPLADLSAMMFPSGDPVAYPNQAAAPAQSYDDILKSLSNDPTFPLPNTLDELRIQRAVGSGTFVPPSSTFMFNGSADQSHLHDNEVQLLGPMPAYMMQGASFAQQQDLTNGTSTSTFPPNTTNNATFPRNNQFFAPTTSTNNIANVDLETLLGGEEWSGSSVGGYGQMFGPTGGFSNQSSSGASSFTNTNTRGGKAEGAEAMDGVLEAGRSKVGSRAVTFDDLNPGALGWNLDGY